MTSRYHQLYSGELHDAPGRAESWTEYVRYLGNNRWELINEGTDYEGAELGKPSIERLGTKALLLRILQSDADELEGAAHNQTPGARQSENEDREDQPQIGPRATRLFEIAKEESATLCIECLNAWLEGHWPKPKPRSSAPKICKINGVAKKGIWLGVYRAVFSIETTLGPGYLHPPQRTGITSFCLTTSSGSDQGWRVHLNKQQMAVIEQFTPALKALQESLTRPQNRVVTAIPDALPDQSQNKVTSIEYYDDWWDTDNYFVCLNRHYIFAANRTDQSPQWKLLNNNYNHWDAVHQRIYRNFRPDKINKEDLPPNLPPPPESIPPEAVNPPPPPPPKPLLAKDYQHLAGHLAQLEGQSIVIYLILYEDTYESSFGDGEFHYPDRLYFDRSAAKEFMGSDHQALMKYHLREGTIHLTDGVFYCQIANKLFDHFSYAEVLSMANSLYANGEKCFVRNHQGL
ncbi:hypothetical protein [Dechloromonas sp. H13]|uniref:hypothetical protein n=1 Tax=Dechloromonas sp. H13 TaxID=2570193 RepID=UPI0018852980|nr:hypothetical protein [Dechloromonas sp. H13]